MGVLLGFRFVATLLFVAACNTEEGDASANLEGEAAMSETETTFDKPDPSDLPDGVLRLRGQIVGGGAPCVQFRTDAGEQISLEGATARDFPIGAQVEITGHFVAISRCMQGRGFVLTDHTSLPNN